MSPLVTSQRVSDSERLDGQNRERLVEEGRRCDALTFFAPPPAETILNIELPPRPPRRPLPLSFLIQTHPPPPPPPPQSCCKHMAEAAEERSTTAL